MKDRANSYRVALEEVLALIKSIPGKNDWETTQLAEARVTIGAALKNGSAGPERIASEKRLGMQSMPDDLMALAKDQFGAHFLQFEIWVGKVIDAAFEVGKNSAGRASSESWRDAVTLSGLTKEKVSELWRAAMFESAANFRGYLAQGRLPNFSGEATLPERFVIKLVDHLLAATGGGS